TSRSISSTAARTSRMTSLEYERAMRYQRPALRMISGNRWGPITRRAITNTSPASDGPTPKKFILLNDTPRRVLRTAGADQRRGRGKRPPARERRSACALVLDALVTQVVDRVLDGADLL